MGVVKNLHVAVLALSAKAYGGDSYFKAIIPALSKYGNGVKFTIFTVDDRYRNLCQGQENIDFYNVSFPGLKNSFVRLVWEQTVLPFLLKKYDVVYTANNVGILNSPIPCVIAVRNMEPLIYSDSLKQPKLYLRNRFLNWLTKQSMKKAGRIIAVSGFVKETLIAGGGASEKIDVVYHGIDDLSIAVQTKNKKEDNVNKFVFSAAKFVRYANLELLFRAFARMKELGFKGELLFAGGPHDRKYEAEMKELIRELKIEFSVRFLGYIKRERMQELMRECDLFMFPSKLEACPFTLLEAMRQGAAIIATTSRPMPEFCLEAAILEDPNNWDTFGKSAFSITENPEIKEALSMRALGRAGNFTWENNIKQLTETFSKAVSLKNL